ncbi:MAG TPA: hypothetical protein ENO22_07330 [candidate division Zixibacteria bacterium]|nr:hypothetical protein [candidate division Zixibacteria bacterium]
MSYLNEQQKKRALEVMNEYLNVPPDEEGKTKFEKGRESDKERLRVIETELRPLLEDFMASRIGLSEFKTKVDGINKRENHWGFKGIKGQMFFNMVVNVADDLEECEQEIKTAIALPADEQIASSRIKTFHSYIKRLIEDWVEAGNTWQGAPKAPSIPFFLSYFWQIQDWKTWPVYFTSSVRAMTDLNLWQPSDDMARNYLDFKHILEELAELFSKKSGKPFGLYSVEHVFWYIEKKETGDNGGGNGGKPGAEEGILATIKNIGLLPESYVPPIVSVLPYMARNHEDLTEAVKRSGSTLDRLFEKYLDAAFTVLGYHTKLLGQGVGRVPDGLALSYDDYYAIIWDAKVRTKGYSMGTDDRTIRDYVTTQSRDLRKRGQFRNIYYMIISSSFADDYDDAIRLIKMETDVNEVVLAEAKAIVELVDTKLRDPIQITLGPDGIQRLFAHSGILTADLVKEQLL